MNKRSTKGGTIGALLLGGGLALWAGCARPRTPAERSTGVEAAMAADARAATGAVARSRAAGRTVPPTVIPTMGGVLLNIAARRQSAASPRAGWCGETAIQEALLFHGAYVPQRLINRAGKPQNPDLYASDIPVALRALGVDFESYPWSVRGFARFHRWLQAQLRRKAPVLAGMKIHPTQHPRWGLDHFVLVVGFDAKHVTVNTTWGRRETKTVGRLQTRAKGLSFKNRYDRYYGLRIRGFTGAPKGALPVRLFVQREDSARLVVTVKCEGLARGRAYVVHRYDGARAGFGTAVGARARASTKAKAKAQRAARSVAFEARGPAHVFLDTLDPRQPSRYFCLRRLTPDPTK